MSSSVQDPEISPEFRQENSIPVLDPAAVVHLLAALQLNSAPIHQAATTGKCTKCVTNKRQSPSDFYPEQPTPKRAALQPPSFSAAISSDDQLLQNGFTKTPFSPSTGLTRTLSASMLIKNHDDQFSDGTSAANSPINNISSEENSGVTSVSVPTRLSQKPQQRLHRTYSEPIPETHKEVTSSATPKPPADGKDSLISGLQKQESPDTKMLRRMKDRVREMRKRWKEFINEEEEEEEEVAASENYDHCPPEDDYETSQGTEVSESEEASHDQEAVWVERKGEVLILHFKCPCSKGYQILLSENSCYYKLSSF